MIEFLLFAMHEDPVALGLMIFLLLLVFIGIPAWLISHSKSNHVKRHQFHSELMCDYCRARQFASPREAHTRWPLRVTGYEPPRGTG